MSNQLDQRAVAPKRSAPHPWARVLIGLLGFGAAAVLVGAWVLYYLQTRPVDLRAHTAALTDIVEQVLAWNQTPADHMRKSEPRVEQDAAAVWNAYDLDVVLPVGKPAERCVAALEQALKPNDVAMVQISQSGPEQRLQLSFAGHPFLAMRLEEHPRADLTAACKQIADEIQAVLQTQGVPVEDIKRAAPESKEDDRSAWTFTRIEAPLPPNKTAAAIESLLETAITISEVRIQSQIGIGGTTTLAVTHKGLACVDLVLRRTDIVPSDEEPLGPRLPALNGGVLQPSNGNGDDASSMPALEELPLDSSGLDDMDLGRKLTGTPFTDGPPRVAIIVDDGGYGGAITDKVLALHQGLTLAILPNTPFAADTARRAAELGFGILLHMPMDNARIPGQITPEMKPKDIQDRVARALAQVPGAKGLNNHMGSTFTANETAVKALLEACKEQGVYFVDSRTTPRSKAYDTAMTLGVLTATRDVFLDNTNDANYIIGQFNHLMAVAKEQGYAIGICHFRPTTIQVLTQMLPQLDRNGIRLVHVSELVSKNGAPPQQDNLLSRMP